MPDSTDPIEAILGRRGLLARSLKEFEVRPSQIQMAHLILESIHHKIPALVEAGTGTGKTLGYLVPILLSEKKAVISTGTKNLQEQIFFKDIPILSDATGNEIDAMLMKGRTNYLCLYRYHQFFSQKSLLQSDHDMAKKRIEKWLTNTQFADRAELSWIGDDDPLWDALSSTSEQCLGTECLHWDDCFLNHLRRRAAQARIIIVNHHLFFADLMVKKGGFGEIIPRSQMVIFDEAHNIEEIATSYFGERLSTRQLLGLVHDLEKEKKSSKKGDADAYKDGSNFIKTGVEQLRTFFNGFAEKGRLAREDLEKIDIGPASLIKQGLIRIKENLHASAPLKNNHQILETRASELLECLETILSLHDANWLNWYEKRAKNIVLHASPLDISQTLKDLLYKKVHRIVFTSATLSTNKNFDYLRSRIGLSDDVLVGIYPSHFDFKNQTLMFIPKDLPPPNHAEFGQKIAEKIASLLTITSGRALILFTSYYNLNLVHQLIFEKIPYTVYRQGEAPRSVLLEKFREDTHSVLFATGSFWQGVDVPGEALSCLIVDKLPFDSPGEPLVGARIDAIRARDGNPFMEYQLPSAIISLRQGLGRLIRNSSDRGILAVLDTRIIKSRYGRFFFNSLPEIPICHDLSAIKGFFEKESRP
jgi:ATP-dependent DNA helicase DinG